MSDGGDAHGLPRVDEHCVEVDVGADRVWRALMDELARQPRRGAGLVAAILGCSERRPGGAPDRPGSTLVGFRVAQAQPPARLTLAGRHRLSRYALTVTVAQLAEDRSRLCAATDAAFPGPHGRAYRAIVVGSGVHARTVLGLLRRIARRARLQP